MIYESPLQDTSQKPADFPPLQPHGSHIRADGKCRRYGWHKNCPACKAEDTAILNVRRCACGELLMRGQEKCAACEVVFSPQPIYMVAFFTSACVIGYLLGAVTAN